MPRRTRTLLRHLIDKDQNERIETLRQFSPTEQRALQFHWRLWARDNQIAPPGDWRLWLILAGRGFGKTRAGAEWVREQAAAFPKARIALIGASLGEARAVMVEGESGILATSPPEFHPAYEPSLKRLTWPNGAQATLYSAAEPESLRGPQHSHAWCDELGKWENGAGRADAAWDNLAMGLRLGEHPRITVTTTPRAVALLRRVMAQPGVAVTRGRSDDNRDHLPERFIEDIGRLYAGTAYARQELDGELIEDVDGALWTRALMEACRDSAPVGLSRVVVGVDPPASSGGDACGIIVCALGEDGAARVLADASVEKARPERWARAVAGAAQAWGADRVIAEANQGGAMVESVLRAADLALPVRLVHASRGKSARAEPVAALYEAGRVKHAGLFARLEDEMCAITATGTYHGPGRSPDRADALVWALSELMLGKRREPRVWVG